MQEGKKKPAKWTCSCLLWDEHVDSLHADEQHNAGKTTASESCNGLTLSSPCSIAFYGGCSPMGGALAFSKFSFQRRCCRRGRFRVFAFSIIVKTLSLRGAFIHEVRQKGMWYSSAVLVKRPLRGRQISSSERNEMPVCAAHLEKMQYSGVVVVECPPKGCQISSSERNAMPAGAVRPIYVQFYQKPAMNICLQFCVMCAIINKIELPRPQAQIDFSTSGGVFLCPEPAISRKQF